MRSISRLWALLLTTALPLDAHAGLSLDEALARHRRPVGTLLPATPFDTVPDGLTLAVGGPGSAMPPLLRPAIDGAGGVHWLGRGGTADGLQLRWGVGWRNTDGTAQRVSLDGTELSLPLGAGRAYASVQRRHWGPAWAGSLILDAAAQPVPALGWRKTDPAPFDNRWLAWIGPWSADVFIGQLSGHDEPRRPKLIGTRLQAMPLPGLEIGVSRTIQWGGSGRPQSLRSLWQALIGNDNVDAPDEKINEPGNQLAGADVRYSLALSPTHSASVYTQVIGEDESGGLPSHFLGSVGVDFSLHRGARSLRLFAESANTVMGDINSISRPGGAYRHGIYRQGYTQQGRPLAFPAGGDVTLSTIGLLADASTLSGLLMLHAGHAHAGAQLYATTGSLRGADAALVWRPAPQWRVGASLAVWHDPVDTRTRLQTWVERSFP